MADLNIINYIKNAISRIIQYFSRLKPTSVKFSDYSIDIESRSRVVKLLYYYKGQMLSYLDSIIDRAYSDPNEANELKKRKETCNIISYICDNVANVFKNGIIIKPLDENDAEIYDSILKANSFDILLKQIEKLVFLIKTIFIKVYWDDIDSTIKFQIITPEKIDVKTSDIDSQKLDRITYSLNDISNLYSSNRSMLSKPLIFASWSDSEYTIVDQAGTIQKNLDNLDNTNPYSIIPFIRIRESHQYDDSYIQWPGDDLETIQDSINLSKTELNYLFSLQSFSIPVLINPDDRLFDKKTNRYNIPIGPGRPIILRSTDENAPEPDFKFASPNANFEQLQNAIDKEVKQALFLYGINISDMVESAERPSAESIKLSNSTLDEKRKNMQQIYSDAIKEIFDVVKIIWNTHNTNQLKDGITVEFPDAKVVETIDEEIKKNEYLLGMNFTSILDILMSKRTDLTSIEDAIKEIEANKLLNARCAPDYPIELGGQSTIVSLHTDESLSETTSDKLSLSG